MCVCEREGHADKKEKQGEVRITYDPIASTQSSVYHWTFGARPAAESNLTDYASAGVQFWQCRLTIFSWCRETCTHWQRQKYWHECTCSKVRNQTWVVSQRKFKGLCSCSSAWLLWGQLSWNVDFTAPASIHTLNLSNKSNCILKTLDKQKARQTEMTEKRQRRRYAKGKDSLDRENKIWEQERKGRWTDSVVLWDSAKESQRQRAWKRNRQRTCKSERKQANMQQWVAVVGL